MQNDTTLPIRPTLEQAPTTTTDLLIRLTALLERQTVLLEQFLSDRRDPVPELIDGKALAHLRGVSEATFYRHQARGLIGPEAIRSHPGGAVRYRRQEALEWIAAGVPDRKTWRTMKSAGKR